MEFDDLTAGRQLFCGEGKPELFGRGPKTVRGSAYVQGPEIIGDPGKFSNPSATDTATLMCAETQNPDMQPTPFYSLMVQTYARVKSYLKVDTLLSAKLIKAKIIYCETLMAQTKNFLIDHPLKKGKKLVHACLEGPENAVYIRGRLTNRTVIDLPDYWENLVNERTVTVSLTAIGAHQDIIVKRIGENQVHLQAKGGMPIDCFYHIFAERKDVNKLEIEIDGD
jgi:hypothetical protein